MPQWYISNILVQRYISSLVSPPKLRNMSLLWELQGILITELWWDVRVWAATQQTIKLLFNTFSLLSIKLEVYSLILSPNKWYMPAKSRIHSPVLLCLEKTRKESVHYLCEQCLLWKSFSPCRTRVSNQDICWFLGIPTELERHKIAETVSKFSLVASVRKYHIAYLDSEGVV